MKTKTESIFFKVMILVLTGALLLTTAHAGAAERGDAAAEGLSGEPFLSNSKSPISDEGEITGIITNLENPELKFWLTGTTAYHLDPGYSPVMIFKNTLGGEGIEVKPGTKTRQAYLIKDGRAERLERALDTRFYRAAHFTESFPRDFDYLGFCDYREQVMTLVPNPFTGQATKPVPTVPVPEPIGEESVYACNVQAEGKR